MDVITDSTQLLGRIAVGGDVLGGRPHIARTQIPVTTILSLLRRRLSVDEVKAAYPEVDDLDIQAALAYAEARLRFDEPDPEDESADDEGDRITVDPRMLVGKPTIKGTRISVSFILNRVANGQTPEQIVDDFPFLSTSDVKAAILYASKRLEYSDNPPLSLLG